MTQDDDKARGRLFVISGPSGSGKTSIVSRLKCLPGVFYSVSATSREARPGEVDGRDYRFVSRQEFERMAAEGELAEHAEVAGNLYGTPRRPLEEALAEGRTALIDIDVQGAMQIRKAFPAACLVFITPPSMDVLGQRLRARGTESEKTIEKRLELARREMEYLPKYDVAVENDDLDRAVEKVEAIVTRM